MISHYDFENADTRIIIQRPTETRDGTFGQKTYDYTDIATVWAIRVKPNYNRTNEEVQGNKVQTNRRERFVIRYSATVSVLSEKMRILDGAYAYELSDIHIRKREGFIMIEGIYIGVTT